MNQKFQNDDRLELEAHFAERVQAYIEIGETPEQALISAREKFGETKAVVRELKWQKALRSPLTSGVICAMIHLVMAVLTKSPWASLIGSVMYAILLGTQREVWGRPCWRRSR